VVAFSFTSSSARATSHSSRETIFGLFMVFSFTWVSQSHLLLPFFLRSSATPVLWEGDGAKSYRLEKH
jgi:hypothetical protein